MRISCEKCELDPDGRCQECIALLGSYLSEIATVQHKFGEIIKNPRGVVKLRIRAGLELLQREADRERLLDWLQIAATLPPAAQRVYKWEAVGTRVLIASGIEPEGLVKSAEELAAEDEAALQQQQALSGQQAAQDMAINAAKVSPEGESPGATA